MNEKMTSVATTANIITAVTEVVKALDSDIVDVPTNDTEIVQDVQAAINRLTGGAPHA